MKPKFLSGIGALLAAMLIVGAIFVPVVSATTSENVQDNIANENALGLIGQKGDDFLDCHGWLTKETNWIRYGGWANCSYEAGYLSVKATLLNRDTAEKMSHTANSAQHVDSLQTQDNLEAHPPAGRYHVLTEAWSLQPSHDVLHYSPVTTWP